MAAASPPALPSPPASSGARGARRTILFLVKALITLGLVAWLVHTILAREGIDALGARLGAMHVGWVVLAVALHGLAVGAGVWRWALLLEAQGLRLARATLARSFLIGRFVGAFTPSTTGLDGYRIWDVARRTKKTGRAAGAIVIEKLVGLIGMTATSVALIPFGADRLLGPAALPMALGVLAGATVGLAVLLSPRARALSVRLAPGPVRRRLVPLVEALGGEGVDRAVLLKTTGLGLVSHVTLSAVFLATGLALGVRVSPFELLVVGNAIIVATLLPLSIGGVGVRESVAVVLLGAVAVAPADATLLALLGYVTGQVPALAGGALMLLERMGGETASDDVANEVAAA